MGDDGFEDTVDRAALDATLPASDLASSSDADAHADADSYRRGDTLGRYVVLDELGRGAMGAVYTAYDPELDRRVAVKVLHPDAQSSSAKTQGRGRLVREAKAMARLNHPNVIQVFDVGTLEGSGDVYIAMEYVPGRSLGAWLLEEPRDWREILEVYTQAGLGLAHAHSQGVVHRDFKPDNCLIDEQGRVRVIDFGIASRRAQSPEDAEALARLTEGGSDPATRELAELARTQAGAVIGTPAYMSFEQLEGREADARSDQFALCVAIYEALYKQPPFAGRAFLERMVEVMEGRVRPAPEHSPAPDYLEPVLRRGLSTDSDDRFPSVEALLAALEPRSEERGAPVRWLALGGAALLVAAAVGAVALVDGEPPPVCRGLDAPLAEVWSPARREALRASLGAATAPRAQETFTRVAAALDARA